MASNPVRMLGIQYLRGIAAMMVVLYHICESHGVNFTVGSAGVDIFFIISGFVMWISTYGRNLSFTAFMTRRIERLVPLYWLATLATAALILAKPQFFTDANLTLPNLLRTFLFLPYYNISQQPWPVILQGWTLNVEMFFYLVVGICFCILPRYHLASAFLSLATLVTLHFTLPLESAPARQWTNPLLLELLAGLCLGKACTSGLLRHAILGWVLSACAIAAFTTAHFMAYEHGPWRALQMGLPALALVAGLVMIESHHGMIRIKLMEFLGDASYSIYLWHGFFLTIATGLILRLNLSGPGKVVVELAFGTLLPVLAYLLIEKKITRYFQIRRKAR